jgi:hypothetical protein
MQINRYHVNSDFALSKPRILNGFRVISFAEKLLSPRGGFFLFVMAILIYYFFVPLSAYYIFDIENEYFLQLSFLTLIAVSSMILGCALPLFDGRYKMLATRGRFDPVLYSKIILVLFVLFIFTSALTAPTIPILSALQGADTQSLALERGQFFKTRIGLMSLLIYGHSIFVNILMPYCIVHLLEAKSKLRYLSILIFFLYSLLFLVKALFLFLLLPYLAYVASTGRLRASKLWMYGLAAATLLIALIELASQSSIAPSSRGAASFLSAQYSPATSLDYFLWRAFSVPVFSAADTLAVHSKWFGGDPLLGSTSSVVSAVFGLERINLERSVFEYQFGGWNEIANTNALYVSDAFANFGIIGVVTFSIIVGIFARSFIASKDIGYKCLWTTFFLQVFSGGLIAVILSNGFLYIFVHALTFGVGRR